MGAWAFLNRCDDYDRCAFLGQRSDTVRLRTSQSAAGREAGAWGALRVGRIGALRVVGVAHAPWAR